MKNNRVIAIVSVMCVLLISVPVFAHHSGSAFDQEHPVTMKGAVASFEWSNPHVFIGLDVKNDKGEVEQWRIEANRLQVRACCEITSRDCFSRQRR